MAVKALAGGGGEDLPLVALKEPHPELLLHFLQILRGRRLRHIEALRRAGEVAQLIDQREEFQLAQGHVKALLSLAFLMIYYTL